MLLLILYDRLAGEVIQLAIMYIFFICHSVDRLCLQLNKVVKFSSSFREGL
jgi:hypothetical protein